MAPCPAGENDVALAPGYAANVEVATRHPEAGASCRTRWTRRSVFDTPGATTIEAVAQLAGVPAGALIKAFPIIVGEDELRLVLVRGDHRVNEIKLGNTLGAPFRPAQPSPSSRTGSARRATSARSGSTSRSCVDAALDGDVLHRRRQRGRRAPARRPARAATSRATTVDVRNVEAGDTVDGHEIRIEPAIEIGNIFKLGTRYSVPLGATYLDEDGTSKPIWMGSYGIGPARICAAAVEQFADEKGISWPRALAPFDIHLVGLGKPDTPERALADKLYEELRALGLDVIYDDRDRRAGREVRRRRAARLPAAADGRRAHARVRRGRGAGPARSRDAFRPARGGG